MEAEMREAAITAVNVAMSRYDGLNDQCTSVKGMMEGRYNGNWCCFISENFYSYNVSHASGCYLYMTLDNKYILVFKCP